MPRIVGRSRGLRGKLQTVECLIRTIAHAGHLRVASKIFELELDGSRFRVDSGRGDLTPFATIWIEREYEPDARFALPRDGTVIDVGAHVGFQSIRVARALPEGRVIAIEPDPETHTRLRRNVELNGLTNVFLEQCAIAPDTGCVAFVSAAHSVSSRLEAVAGRHAVAPGARTIEVETLPLDALISRYALTRVDLLKMDAERLEFGILRNSPATLALTDRLMIEIHDPKERAAIDRVLLDADLIHVYRSGRVHGYLRRGLEDRGRGRGRARGPA